MNEDEKPRDDVDATVVQDERERALEGQERRASRGGGSKATSLEAFGLDVRRGASEGTVSWRCSGEASQARSSHSLGMMRV